MKSEYYLDDCLEHIYKHFRTTEEYDRNVCLDISLSDMDIFITSEYECYKYGIRGMSGYGSELVKVYVDLSFFIILWELHNSSDSTYYNFVLVSDDGLCENKRLYYYKFDNESENTYTGVKLSVHPYMRSRGLNISDYAKKKKLGFELVFDEHISIVDQLDLTDLKFRYNELADLYMDFIRYNHYLYVNVKNAGSLEDLVYLEYLLDSILKSISLLSKEDREDIAYHTGMYMFIPRVYSDLYPSMRNLNELGNKLSNKFSFHLMWKGQ